MSEAVIVDGSPLLHTVADLEAAVIAEREMCAKLAEAFANEVGEPWLGKDLAKALRERQ